MNRCFMSIIIERPPRISSVARFILAFPVNWSSETNGAPGSVCPGRGLSQMGQTTRYLVHTSA